MGKVSYIMKKQTSWAPKKIFTIKGISDCAPLKLKRRLFDLGFTYGIKIIVKRNSLLGKTCLVELRGVLLTLRRDILNFVLVE